MPYLPGILSKPHDEHDGNRPVDGTADEEEKDRRTQALLSSVRKTILRRRLRRALDEAREKAIEEKGNGVED